jgi:hypothetical protein
VPVLTEFVLGVTHVMKFTVCVHRTTGLHSYMLLDATENNANFLQILLWQCSEVNNFNI